MSSPLEDPNLSELIRDLQADVRHLIGLQEKLVSRETFEAHKALTERRLNELEESRKHNARLAVSGVVLPIVVALVMFLLTGK